MASERNVYDNPNDLAFDMPKPKCVELSFGFLWQALGLSC